MDKHLELFDKELIIRSTANNNRILDLGGSTYKDFVYNTNSPYKFQSTEQQMILGCIYTRSRDDVVFEQGDISKMLEHSLEKWKEKNISSNSELGKDANDKNKWLMELNGNGRYIMLDPIRIREHSLKFPYYVSTERGGMAITQERRDAMEVYSFSDTDIERLKVRLEGLVENKYRQYPNWKSSELERAKGLINDFCNTEYQHGADFSDMTCVGIAHTTITDDEIPIQVNVNLIDYSLERYIDNTLVDKREFDDIADLAMNQLEYLNFDDLISFTDEELEKAGITPENKTAEATSVMDKTMFMIGRGKYDYHTTIIPSVEEQINGLNFRVIDNYGSVLDEFSGAYGIDIKPDDESINSFIRRHIDQNEEKYIKILQENGFDSEGLVKTIYELEESEKYRFGYHFLAPLDKDGYLLYDTAKEFTQIVPEEYYQTADNEKLFKWLSNFDRIKYAEAVEFGNVKYENDVATELSVDYGSEAYKLYESDLYSDTIDKMLMSEMSLEDLLQIQQNIINYRCGMFACTPLHPKEETTYIVQDDIEKAEAYRQSKIYKELPESRARQILSGALDYLSDLLKGQELYNVLSGSVGMTHEELESEGFTLQNYYEEAEDDEEMEM